jgi:hypothetical protein
MIIVGADRTSALDGTALGHTADRVSRYAHCPVLLVRETETNLPSAKRTFTSRPRAG